MILPGRNSLWSAWRKREICLHTFIKDFGIPWIPYVIKFTSKNIIAQKVEFSLNNTPVRIQGEVSCLDKIDASINLSTYADQRADLRKNNPKRLDVFLKCSSKEGKTSGESDIIFLKAFFYFI